MSKSQQIYIDASLMLQEIDFELLAELQTLVLPQQEQTLIDLSVASQQVYDFEEHVAFFLFSLIQLIRTPGN